MNKDNLAHFFPYIVGDFILVFDNQGNETKDLCGRIVSINDSSVVVRSTYTELLHNSAEYHDLIWHVCRNNYVPIFNLEIEAEVLKMKQNKGFILPTWVVESTEINGTSSIIKFTNGFTVEYGIDNVYGDLMLTYEIKDYYGDVRFSNKIND